MNDFKRIFAVGDIHGCSAKLEHLLSRFQPASEDLVVFLGDYIDRGDDSRGVIELLLHFRESCAAGVIFLKGNHELMFMNYLRGVDVELYQAVGGRYTIESYSDEDGNLYVPPEHIEFFENLHLFYESERYFFVHAGVRPGVSLKDQDEAAMLWIRSEFVESDYDWGKRIIFAHTPFHLPRIEKNKIGIDTGAVYGRELTCLILPDMEFVFA